MKSTIEYIGRLSTVSTHIKSGDQIISDAPVDNNGKGAAFSPTDLMSTSLASCILTIMGIAARSHAINMDGTKASVLKTMSDEGPRRVVQIDVTLQMPHRNYSLKEKKILIKASESCPVGRSLHPDIIQNIKLIWNEA
jgi:uncharacterized OsmC-like protein